MITQSEETLTISLLKQFEKSQKVQIEIGILLFNDEDYTNIKQFYRIWKTIRLLPVFKNNPVMKFKVVLTDRSSSVLIPGHDIVTIYNFYDFEDYWNVIKNETLELNNIIKEYPNGNDYTRIYIYFYLLHTHQLSG